MQHFFFNVLLPWRDARGAKEECPKVIGGAGGNEVREVDTRVRTYSFPFLVSAVILEGSPCHITLNVVYVDRRRAALHEHGIQKLFYYESCHKDFL